MKLTHFLSTLTLSAAVSMANAASVTDKYAISSPLAVDSEKMLFTKIFDVELWSDTYPESYNQDMTIRIRLARRVDKSDIIEFVLDEAAEIHTISRRDSTAMYESIDKAITCLPLADTVLDFNFIPGTGVQVSCNDVVGGPVISNAQHTGFLLDVFLHPESEYAGLSKP